MEAGCSVYDIMAKVLDYGLEMSEFKLQLHYYVHFQSNTLANGIETLIISPMGWIVLLLFFYKDRFGVK